MVLFKLDKAVCLSVSQSVSLSVCQSVCPSVRPSVGRLAQGHSKLETKLSFDARTEVSLINHCNPALHSTANSHLNFILSTRERRGREKHAQERSRPLLPFPSKA